MYTHINNIYSTGTFFYVHVTVHRNKFLCNKNQLDALISQIYFGMKLYMFRKCLCPSSGVYSLYTQQWYMSYSFRPGPSCRVSRQNKFVKLVHLVGFHYRAICYDARSHERKKVEQNISHSKFWRVPDEAFLVSGSICL